MKKIIVLLLVVSVSLFFQMIIFLPWWCFLIPVFLLGLILPLEKWKVSPFFWGFVSGFLVWSITTILYEISYSGEMINTISKVIIISGNILYIIIGIIGGIITGLAFYSGFLLRKGREVLNL